MTPTRALQNSNHLSQSWSEPDMPESSPVESCSTERQDDAYQLSELNDKHSLLQPDPSNKGATLFNTSLPSLDDDDFTLFQPNNHPVADSKCLPAIGDYNHNTPVARNHAIQQFPSGYSGTLLHMGGMVQGPIWLDPRSQVLMSQVYPMNPMLGYPMHQCLAGNQTFSLAPLHPMGSMCSLTSLGPLAGHCSCPKGCDRPNEIKACNGGCN